MLITKWMKTDLVVISPLITVREALQIFISKKVGILPSVDQEGKYIGAFTLKNAIKLFMPLFFDSIQNLRNIEDFGELENPDIADCKILDKPIKLFFDKNFPVIGENHSVFSAMAIMTKNHLTDLLVIDNERLTGLVSMVDLGVAFLSSVESNELCDLPDSESPDN